MVVAEHVGVGAIFGGIATAVQQKCRVSGPLQNVFVDKMLVQIVGIELPETDAGHADNGIVTVVEDCLFTMPGKQSLLPIWHF